MRFLFQLFKLELRTLKIPNQILASILRTLPPLILYDIRYAMPGHIRFEEDSPPTAPEPTIENASFPKLETNGQPPVEIDSDDDAPEAVTQTAARDKTKIAKQDATKAIENQRNAERQKRRSQTARLKEQVETSKRGLKRKRTAAGGDHSAGQSQMSTLQKHQENENTVPIEEEIAPKMSRKKALPDLLPDEILAAEPPPRLPTPEPENNQTSRKQPPRTAETLERTLARAAKNPKDVKRGPVSVRALEKKNTLLPPRADTRSRNLLEAMRTRHGALERKPLKKGFATRDGSQELETKVVNKKGRIQGLSS